jgi:pyridoxal phosphate-dependent aminotransferase EpsN
LFAGSKYFTHLDKDSISDQLFNDGICLPSGTNMTEEEQNRVIACIIQTLGL